MSGIVNQTGARSGIVGTTSGTPPVAMTLLHNTNQDYYGTASHTIGSAARGVGPGATGSGYLFQTDYFYYKVLTCGYGFSNGYPAFRLVNTSNAVRTSSTYRYAYKTQDSAATDWDHQANTDAMFNLSQRYDHSDSYGAAGTSAASAGNTHLEITFFNPAGTNRTLVQWAYTQCIDADGDLRTAYGSGHYKDREAHGGFNVFSQPGNNFDGFIQCSVYGMTSMGA